MFKKSETGRIGEDIACEYLINKGFTVIERNFRRPWGELDIVSQAPDGTLVFVEVKTLRRGSGQAIQQDNSAIQELPNYLAALKQEDNLTKAKLIKLQRTSYLYANKNLKLVNDKKGWRIDLVAITLDSRNKPNINHYENIA